MQKTWLPEVAAMIRVEKELKADGRILYPVVRISTIKAENGDLLGIWRTPVAILIIEADQQYVISFTEEKLSVKNVLELIPSLKDNLDTVRRGGKIQID